MPMRWRGSGVPRRRAMAFGNIPTRRCTRTPAPERRANRLPIAPLGAQRVGRGACLPVGPGWQPARLDFKIDQDWRQPQQHNGNDERRRAGRRRAGHGGARPGRRGHQGGAIGRSSIACSRPASRRSQSSRRCAAASRSAAAARPSPSTRSTGATLREGAQGEHPRGAPADVVAVHHAVLLRRRPGVDHAAHARAPGGQEAEAAVYGPRVLRCIPQAVRSRSAATSVAASRGNPVPGLTSPGRSPSPAAASSPPSRPAHASSEGIKLGETPYLCDQNLMVPKFGIFDADGAFKYLLRPDTCCGGALHLLQDSVDGASKRQSRLAYIPFFIRTPEGEKIAAAAQFGEDPDAASRRSTRGLVRRRRPASADNARSSSRGASTPRPRPRSWARTSPWTSCAFETQDTKA